MNHVPAWLTLFALIAAILGCIHEENGRNQGLPMVQAALPKHGFVCVPAITPRLGPVRSKELT